MKRRYNKKKLLNLLILPVVFNSLTVRPVFSADITPGTGETVTLSGTSNVDPIRATGDNVSVTLAKDAKLTVDESYAAVYLRSDSTVTLNAGSSITTTSTDAHSWASGVFLGGDGTSTVSLENNSSITAKSVTDGAEPRSFATGITIYSGENTIITLSNGSSSSASATATKDNSYTGVFAAGIEAYRHLTDDWATTITLSNGSSSSALATASITGDGAEGRASADGINTYGQNNATVTLSDSSSSSATAIVSATGSNSRIVAHANGINMDYGQNDATVTLSNNSSSSAIATASTTGEYGDVRSSASGIFVSTNQTANVTLSNGSNVTAVSTASGGAGSGADASATGMEISAADITISLNNSSVSAIASATGGYTDADSVGLFVSASRYSRYSRARLPSSEAVITLSNGSSISAIGSDSDYGFVAGIYVGHATEATINIDATSSISGSDYAITDGGEGGVATVYNEGLLAGRLQVYELHNSATGILEATLSSESVQMIGGINDDGRYYNTITDSAILADGSTVAIIANDKLGLVDPGDSEEFRILTVETPDGGDWTQSEVALQQAAGYSPMLALSWSASSVDDNTLILQASFLTPAQAGLSANGTAAFDAAYADGLFNFHSSPEDWTPDVSGANMVSQTMFVGASQKSVEIRLAGLITGDSTGLNTGDPLAIHGAWADVRHSNGDQEQNSDVDGFNADTISLTLGYDQHVNDQVTIGVAFSSGLSNVDTKASNEQFNMEDYLLSLYAKYNGGSWFAEGQFAYGWGNVDSNRTVFSSILNAQYDSNVYYARIAAGRDFLKGKWTITPKAAVDYTRVTFDDYQETGGTMVLNVETDDYDICNLGAGVQAERTWNINEKTTLTPLLSAMMYYDVVGDTVETTSNFALGTTPFVTEGADNNRLTADVVAGLTFRSLESPVSFNIGYEYLNSGDFNSHNFSGKLRYEF